MADNLPTRDDYFQVGASEVLARSAARPERERLSRAAVFTEGTDINIIIAACSAMADEATRQLAARMAALYLDSAEDNDLDRLVADRFSTEIVRKQAAPAVVPLQFQRPIPPSAGAGVTYPQGTKFRTEQGTEFALLEAVTLSLGSTGPVIGAAQAVLAGTGGNVAPGAVVQFSGPRTDPAMTVTNVEPGAGGRDVETDQALRERARSFFRTARRGTLSAIEFGALSVEGVESATAWEELDATLGIPTGRVYVTVADRNGQANSILAEAVRNQLVEYRGAGVVVDVITSNTLWESVAYDGIAFVSGTDTRAAVQQLKNLTVVAVNVLAPGEPLTLALLYSLARSVPGAIVREGAVYIPAGDVVPASNETIKTRLELVSVNGV